MNKEEQEMLTFVEEKFEHRLTTEIGKVNERMTEEIGKVNITIANVEKRPDSKIKHSRSDLIKGMFIFRIGQVNGAPKLNFSTHMNIMNSGGCSYCSNQTPLS
ncbi:MAG: hypothetical protein U5R06_01560 [candidate division KSB1 bacterium]|nr:hypothetical protein [candidate division KSB1 bacterium]